MNNDSRNLIDVSTSSVEPSCELDTMCTVEVPQSLIKDVELLVEQYNKNRAVGGSIRISSGDCAAVLNCSRITRAESQVFVDEAVKALKEKIRFDD